MEGVHDAVFRARLRRLAAAAGRALWPLAVALMGMLSGGVVTLGILRPAAAAFVMAAAVAGWPVLPAAAGCIVGLSAGGFSLVLLGRMIPPVLACFSGAVMARSGKRFSVGTGLMLLLCVRLAALPFGTLLLYDILLFLLETALAAVLYYAFVNAMRDLTNRESPRQDNALLMALSLGTLIAGIPDWSAGPFSLPVFGGALLTLSAAIVGGVSLGAPAGLAVGGVLALVGAVDPWMLGGLGLCGLAAGAMKPLGRAGVLSGWTLTAVFLGMLLTGSPIGLMPWASAAAAMAVAAAIPEAAWAGARRWALGGNAAGDPAQLIGKMREHAVSRLHYFAGCFKALSQVFAEVAGAPPGTSCEEVSPLLEAVAQDVCNRCSRRAECWEKQFFTTWNYFVTALARPGRRTVLWPHDFPEEFRAGCLHFDDVITALRAVWGLYRVRFGMAVRLEEGRALISQQLCGVAEVMDDLAGQLNLRLRLKKDLNLILRDALVRQGCAVKELTVHENARGLRVSVKARSCGGCRRCIQEYMGVLSRELGRPMRRRETGCDSAGGYCRLEFYEAGALRVQSSAAQQPAHGGVCGDSWCCRAVDSRSYLMAISDGMGSGSRAAVESSATLNLLRHFYEAGFSDEVIFKTINSVLLLRSGSEMYATVDLCLFDLIACRARFIKIGAAPSFILRGSRVYTIHEPTLPLGILDNVQPAAVNRRIEEGDIIVLMSDGAAGDGKWVEEALPRLGGLSLQAIAERLLEMSGQYQTRDDDRTVVAARVRKGGAMDTVIPARLNHWQARIDAGGEFLSGEGS
ncbi:MAG: SpoIIE family protein phosphatase [Christensenellales bacterium]|jgi:stage II sporulation protein E